MLEEGKTPKQSVVDDLLCYITFYVIINLTKSKRVTMNLAIDIPDNIFFGINQTEQSLSQLLREKLALELYKSSQISLSQGAKMLSMDIYEFMTFVSKHGISIIDDYDIAEEVIVAKSILK
jgi:predicted HTH domain antitoxin